MGLWDFETKDKGLEFSEYVEQAMTLAKALILIHNPLAKANGNDKYAMVQNFSFIAVPFSGCCTSTN